MKGVLDKIGLFFKAGWQWLTAAPRYRGALLCGLSAVGAMIAIGYNGSTGIFAPVAPVPQTSDVVAARISAMSGGGGASSGKSPKLEDRRADLETVEPSRGNNDAPTAKEGPSAKVMESDKSFLVADSEKQRATIQDKGKVKKTTNKPVKKAQRHVSTEKERKFSPSRDVKRVGERITQVFRDIF
jgi:hypothetical protein